MQETRMLRARRVLDDPDGEPVGQEEASVARSVNLERAVGDGRVG